MITKFDKLLGKLREGTAPDEFTNPMTAAGDMIIGGALGSAGRLPKGLADQVLAMDPTGTFQKWVEAVNAAALVSREEWDVNGFATRDTSTIDFVNATRTIRIQPTGVSFEFWNAGIKYTSNGDSVVMSDVEGTHIICYDGTTLTDIANPSSHDVIDAIFDKCLVTILYWDVSAQEVIYFGEERHGKQISAPSHLYHHLLNGMEYISGLGLNSILADENGNTNSHAQFGVDSGTVVDEDLYTHTLAVSSLTGLPIYYLTGAKELNKYVNAGFSVKTTGSGRLSWNEDVGGVWQESEIPNRDCVNYHVFGTPDTLTPIKCMMGQASYANKGAAREGAKTEIYNIVKDGIIGPELRALGTVTFQTSDSYSNDVQARIITQDDGSLYYDWRNETITRTSVGSTDHNSMTGINGGTIGEYYHQTLAQWTESTQYATVDQNGLMTKEQAEIVAGLNQTVTGSITGEGSANLIVGDKTLIDIVTIQFTAKNDADILGASITILANGSDLAPQISSLVLLNPASSNMFDDMTLTADYDADNIRLIATTSAGVTGTTAVKAVIK